MNNKLFTIALILFALFLRVYNINRTTEFLGDQGRDLLVVRGLVQKRGRPAFELQNAYRRALHG